LFFAAAGTPTVVAIGLGRYSYALNGKINRKAASASWNVCTSSCLCTGCRPMQAYVRRRWTQYSCWVNAGLANRPWL